MSEPLTKEAIERACDHHCITYSYYLTLPSFSPERAKVFYTARFIQVVSDVATTTKAFYDAHNGPISSGDYEANNALILPDPEPDVLYDALFAVVELGRYDTKEQTGLLRHELAQRGYAITKVAS